MDTQAAFGIQFVMSIVVFGFLAKWLVVPRLQSLDQREALFWLTIPHAFRHIGLVFLVPGVVHQPLPGYFSIPAAYGDFLAGLVAFATLAALRGQWRYAIGVAWTFNLVGAIDLVNALRHAEVVPHFGAAWYIPMMVVPLLLVTHYLSLRRLMKMTSLAAEPLPQA